MRRIGTLTNRTDAQRFVDYLFTLSIDCTVDIRDLAADDSATSSESAGSEVECLLWIRNEEHVERAKSELAAFRKAPGDSKYQVGGEAEKIRKQQQADEKRKKSLQKKMNTKSPNVGGGALMGVQVRQNSIPVVIGVIICSVIASFSTGFGRPTQSKIPGEPSMEESVFYSLAFVDRRDYLVTKDPFFSIKQGQVWRLITPIFLHGNTFHLAFNMMALFMLGSAVERLHGSVFMALLLVISGVAGGLLQVWLPPASELPPFLAGLAGTPFAIGASGAVFGLFGYLWIRPMLSPNYPIRMMPANVAIMLGFMVFCIFFVDQVANGAHLGGLIAGVIIAAIMSRMPSEQFS